MGEGQDGAADGRGQDRRHAHHQHQPRHHDGGGLPALRQVTHDGTGDDHAGGGAERGNGAKDRESGEVGGEGAADGADGEQHEADHQRDAAAEAVREGALGDLTYRKTGEPGGQGELGGAGFSTEARLDRGEGRQVHVRRGWADSDEQAQQAWQPGGVFGRDVGAHPGDTCGLGWMGVVPGRVVVKQRWRENDGLVKGCR